MFHQLQHVAAVLRGNPFRAVVGSAILELVALLEQSPQSFARIRIESERIRRCLSIDGVWIDIARQRCFHSNDPGSLRVVFPWRYIVPAQFAHQFSSFMLQRGDASRLTVIDSDLSDFPSGEPK